MKLESKIDTSSDSFSQNYEGNLTKLRELEERLRTAREGGGAKATDYIKSLGKLPARQRVEKLIDQGSYFLELSPLAGDGLYEGGVPSGGLVTGIGTVQGRPVMIVANDPTVKGGTYFPITVKKHLRAQEIARDDPYTEH